MRDLPAATGAAAGRTVRIWRSRRPAPLARLARCGHLELDDLPRALEGLEPAQVELQPRALAAQPLLAGLPEGLVEALIAASAVAVAVVEQSRARFRENAVGLRQLAETARRVGRVGDVGVAFAGGRVEGATPTVSTPTVPLPPPPVLPVPTLPSPKLPISSPPLTVSTPSAPGVSPSTLPLARAGVGMGSPSSSTRGGSGSSGTSGSSRTSRRASISHLRSSRTWIAINGPKSRRRAILVFRLARTTPVSFTVTQVSPVCGVAGKFMVHGHPGVNRVRFNGKVQGRQLAPGTYRIDARTRGSARVLHVTLVVVGAGIPSSSELRAARRRNVCGGTLGARATRTSGGFTAVSRSLHGPAKSSIVRHQNPSGTGPHGHRSSAAPFSPARVSQNATNPFVVAAFGVAVILLGFAALPQRAVSDPRLNDVLVRHRAEVAMAGAGALAAALLALALA
jgi:hypothetical protein